MRLLAALTLALSAGSAGAQGTYLLGAAKVDVTPPPFDAAVDAAMFPNCPAAVFTGPRLFGLQEYLLERRQRLFRNLPDERLQLSREEARVEILGSNGKTLTYALVLAGSVERRRESSMSLNGFPDRAPPTRSARKRCALASGNLVSRCRARSVLPHPGGPTSSSPRLPVTPSAAARSRSLQNRST